MISKYVNHMDLSRILQRIARAYRNAITQPLVWRVSHASQSCLMVGLLREVRVLLSMQTLLDQKVSSFPGSKDVPSRHGLTHTKVANRVGRIASVPEIEGSKTRGSALSSIGKWPIVHAACPILLE